MYPETPLVSVIIPTYRRPDFLDEAIESVVRQNIDALECLVIDDRSPTPVAVNRNDHLRVRVIRHSRNLGPGGARNTGLAHAMGEFVMFLDDDDQLVEGRIRKGVDEIGSHRMHACAARFGQKVSKRTFEGDMRATLLHEMPPSLSQVLFRREDCLQFDSSLRVSEDVEWWLRMSDRADFAWDPEVGLQVRLHDEVRSGVTDELRWQCRQRISMTYRQNPAKDRATSAFLEQRAASAALLAGHRFQATKHAVRAFATHPNRRAARVAGAAVFTAKKWQRTNIS